eukprot:CAMPEP_0194046360 /NCGR_PEP_ID=MMETSP0009_2-20130614/21043_1 /TAXON_ID=210454 /ORGANISM="Grammatophora oceanica, Strain CCMP 410" /LENGTH=94 /DNA_ID=CAMNT_0038691617 /DNA_START=94 /DNA_END=378 /DNA_ORIENTATION=-
MMRFLLLVLLAAAVSGFMPPHAPLPTCPTELHLHPNQAKDLEQYVMNQAMTCEDAVDMMHKANNANPTRSQAAKGEKKGPVAWCRKNLLRKHEP